MATAVEPPVRIILLTDEPDLEHLMRELLATLLPSTTMESVTPSTATVDPSEAAIVDHTVRSHDGFAMVQELRARGYVGGIVLLATSCTADLERRLLTVGPARCLARADMVVGLSATLVEVTKLAVPAGDVARRLEGDLRRVQQVLAAGEVTTRIQHTLNNPLTALLAEAQLLELEPLSEEHRAAVHRIIELCRRVVAMVRGLEARPRPG
jgi:signal transduction histidine kinase